MKKFILLVCFCLVSSPAEAVAQIQKCQNIAFLNLYYASDVQCRKNTSIAHFGAFAHLRQGRPLQSGKSGFDHFSSDLLAQSESNYIFSGDSQQQIKANEQSDAGATEENAQQIWDNTVNDYVIRNYGSTESPAFSNREDINPNESDYGYGSTSGAE